MRLPTPAHRDQAWRIHEIAPDFTIEDVWALPTPGQAEEFPRLLDVLASLNFPDASPLPVRLLWKARDRLGHRLGLGRISAPIEDTGALPIPGTGETTLRGRVADDLHGTAVVSVAPWTPFQSLYCTDNEYAAELSNRTVHCVLHLGWVGDGQGRYRGQMAVLVKPRGPLGRAYMLLIKPFRYALIYPAFLRALDRAWRARPTSPA